MADLDEVQLKASIPRALKLKAFAALSLKDVKFKQWLEGELSALVEECAELAPPPRDPQAVVSDVEAVGG
jgi:hypothetical protein